MVLMFCNVLLMMGSSGGCRLRAQQPLTGNERVHLPVRVISPPSIRSRLAAAAVCAFKRDLPYLSWLEAGTGEGLCRNYFCQSGPI